MARRAAGHVGRLRGVAEALGTEGSLRPAPHGAYREDRACGQEDVHARACRTLRPRARCTGEAVEQRTLYDAGTDRVQACGRADQGSGRLRTVQVRKWRVATGRAGCLSTE